MRVLLLSLLISLSDSNLEVNASSSATTVRSRLSQKVAGYPYTEDEGDVDDIMIQMSDVDKLSPQQKQKNEEDGAQDQLVELDTDSGSKSEEKSEIEKAAEDFVDSDETLNAEIEAETEKKLPTHSGYPYND
uniref:Uncharacterized protein n=1 Tax=Strombidium rassoulzadegani TaxID=1082188 RepID=A0A7S3FTS9_9SPIT